MGFSGLIARMRSTQLSLLQRASKFDSRGDTRPREGFAMFSAICVAARSKSFVHTTCWILVIATARGLAAQDKKKPSSAEPAVVPVSQVIERQITDHEEFPGRVEAVESVRIASRVTGYLTQATFKEGADVKKGDLLFEIDSRPYQAQVDQAEAEFRGSEARLKRAELDYQRANELLKNQAIMREEFDKFQVAQQEAQAALEAAKASLEAHRLTLGFCKIVSPIDGRAGGYNLTPGNLVKQDETVLTTIVSLDPVNADFEIDERTFLRLIRRVGDGRTKSFAAGAGFPVFVQAADESDFLHEGTLTFLSNEFDRSKGTIVARGTFQNPSMKNGQRLFTPGMFVKVRIPVGEPRRALLVSNEALRSDQFSRYVLVVNDDDSVDARPVKVGSIQDDGLRVIEHGIKTDERVVVSGVQIEPQTKIHPKLVPMPTNSQE
jgi:membrane fusion protein, multidrug efflux system